MSVSIALQSPGVRILGGGILDIGGLSFTVRQDKSLHCGRIRGRD
jgi:hypothetical protein